MSLNRALSDLRRAQYRRLRDDKILSDQNYIHNEKKYRIIESSTKKPDEEIEYEEAVDKAKNELDLLDSHFALISFDETVNELLQFLNLEVINLVEEKDNILINYININLEHPPILEHINKHQVGEEIYNDFISVHTYDPRL